ncbi:MAG: hypothetical protein BGO68_04925 [Candidatus Amoebophilus sp. 36-38]|nr:MAG: hypothetical protein BGO68_04925 [Candidatus Amoebophilus sp. 36-38]
MTRKYNLNHRLVACVLFISLFLQSCLNSPIPPISTNSREQVSQVSNEQDSIREQRLGTNSLEHEVALSGSSHPLASKDLIVTEDKLQIDQLAKTTTGSNIQQSSTISSTKRRSDNPTVKKFVQEKRTKTTISAGFNQLNPVKTQLNKESTWKFKTRQGYQIKIVRVEGKWQADLIEEIGKFTRQYRLPVYFEPGMSLKKLALLPPVAQEQYLHVSLPNPHIQQAGQVFVGKLGIRGGGNTFVKGTANKEGGDNPEKEQEKEKSEEKGKEKDLEENKNPEELFKNGKNLLRSCNNERNSGYFPLAMNYLRQAAKLGHPEAQALLDSMKPARQIEENCEKHEKKEKEKEKGVEQEEKREISPEELQEYAKNGNVRAQFKLGQIAYQAWLDNPTEEARSEVEKWLEKAAAQGHQRAISLLRRLHQVPFSQEHMISSPLDPFHNLEIKEGSDGYLSVDKSSGMSTRPYTYKEALAALETKDPKVKVINLRYEQLTKEQFEDLKQAIDDNFVVGYIEWCEIPSDCQALKEQIENKLVHNICNYTYHPNDYVHGLLASHVYKEPKEGEQDFNDINKEDDGSEKKEELKLPLPPNMNRDWKVVQFEDDSTNSGFYSALYVNEGTHQAVLSFQGTKYLLKDLVVEDMQGVLGNSITKQQTLAYKATKAAVKYAKEEGFNLSITGHSLGGYLAELGIAFCHLDFNYRQVKGIVFDSPGTHTKLNTFKSNVKNLSTKFSMKKLPITTYLSAPNFVNVCHGHVGEVYRLYPHLKGLDWFDRWLQRASNVPMVGKRLETVYKGLLSITGHSLDLILALFNPATGKPLEDNYVRVGDWPKLNTESIEYVGKESSAGGLVGGALGGGIGRLIGSIVLGNLGTLGSVATVIADCQNVNQRQFWTTHSKLDKEYREVDLESTEECELIYVGHYRVSPISIDKHPLRTKENESIDGYLYALWEDREEIQELKTNDITGAVLNNILQDYTIVNEEDKPCVQLTKNQTHIQALRDKMQRAKEILTSARIKGALKHSKNQAICNYVGQELRKQFQEEKLKKLHRLHRYLSIDKLAGYIPRKDKEKEIAQKLEEKGICVVYGYGGVGKSTLVAEYGHKLKDQQIVCWTQADTVDKLIASYEYAAREIGVSEERLTYLKKETGSNYLAVLAREVYKYIDHQKPALLILDNAKDPALIKGCLTHKPDWIKVVITTQNGKDFKDYGQVKLGPFTEEEGKTYIQQRLQSLNPSETDVMALLNKDVVGLIPKKLELATAYIREISFMTIQRYIEKLQALKKQHKKQQGKLVLPVVNLGLETLVPQAQLLMRHGAYLDPDFIPVSLINELLGLTDEEELNAILSPIERLSLVTIINDSGQIGIQIHQEVQAACKEYQGWKENGEGERSKQNLLLSLIKVLHEYMPEVTNYNLDQEFLYVPNVIYVVEVAIQEGLKDPLLADLMFRMGNYFRLAVCTYQTAKNYYVKSYEMRKSLYPYNHPDIANSIISIGDIFSSLGENEGALVCYKQALVGMKDSHTNNHLQIATLLNNIGMIYAELGKSQKALEYLNLSLETRQDFYKVNHPDIAKSFNNIACFYQKLKQYEQALEYYKLAFSVLEDLEKSGIHVPMFKIGILNNLGTISNELGHKANEREKKKWLYETGLFYHQQALATWKNDRVGNYASRDDIICMVDTIYNLGKGYSNLGKNKEGLKYLEQALEMKKALYPGNHPDIDQVQKSIILLKEKQEQENEKSYEQDRRCILS